MGISIGKGVRSAIAIALVYAAFGVVWVAGSDAVVAAVVTNLKLLALIQTLKGWLFVLVSAALIFVVARQLMRALEASESRYRLLFADSPEPLVLYDPADFRLVEVNAAAGLLFGYDPPEMRGIALLDLLPPSVHAGFRREMPRLQGDMSATGMWQIKRKDGRIVDVATHGQPVEVDGRRLRLVLIDDVSARLRSESELLRALEDLDFANRRVRELSHAISHDLQEPLRQVSGFVQLLQRRYHDRLDGEAAEFISYAVEGVGRLKTLIGDVEVFAGEGPDARLRLVDVGALLAELVAEMRTDARIVLEDMPTIQADPARLQVVFHALIDNALKFHRPNVPCEIDISAERAEGGWVFKVADNGIGIPPEHREAIFKLFRRLHSRAQVPGNGTGLAIAQRMIQLHGGRIWAEERPGGGSVFCFALPSV